MTAPLSTALLAVILLGCILISLARLSATPPALTVNARAATTASPDQPLFPSLPK